MKEGEEDHDKWLWGNLFLGCLIFGAIIDGITGACHCLNPQYRSERIELYYHYNTFKAMRVTLEKEMEANKEQGKRTIK